MNDFIPLSVPNLKGNEQKYVADAIRREWVATGGAYIDRFERDFAAYCKSGAAVACQSGTAAMHLALVECGVGRGDLVVAPALTFIASINPIRYVGADPVFMDCDDGLCLDIDKLARYLARECERRRDGMFDKNLDRRVRAIAVVHVFGNGADMDALMPLARQYGLPVIEDAAEAVGTFYTSGTYAGMMAGVIGDFGVYSFNGNKIITTGGGGMLVAKDPDKLRHARHLSTQAKSDELHYAHDAVGYNYRMTNVQAAIGVAQLEQLETFIGIKDRNYRRYGELGVELLPFGDGVRPNRWFYCHRTADRDGLMKHLAARNIQSRPIWKLNHLHPMYRDCRTYRIETAPLYRDSVVNIPCGSNLSEEEVARVAGAIREFDGR